VLEFLARTIKREKIKEIQIRKKEVKLFLFTDNMKLYFKGPEDSTKKLDLINMLGNVSGHKINTKNQLFFYIPIRNRLRENKPSHESLKKIK
jgi:hypothetical protein